MSTSADAPAPLTSEEMLTWEWLSSALSLEASGEVTVSVVEFIRASGIKIRIEISEGSDVLAQVCVKGFMDKPGMNFSSGSASLSLSAEPRFYEHLAGLPIQTAEPLYTGVDANTGHGIVIMKDLKVAGAVFLDVLQEVDVATVEAALVQLAALHGSTWGARAPEMVDWLEPRHESLLTLIDAPTLQAHIDAELSAPESLRDAVRVRAAFEAVVTMPPIGARSIAHGDAHVGNLFRAADGTCGWVDWQLVHLGNWAIDVAYVIGSALPPEERREHERSLVEHYREALARQGIDVPSSEECWLAYRCGLVYGFYLWVITRGIPAEIRRPMTRRLGTAVEDHDSFALLGL